MKTCSSCETELPSREVVCLSCREVLEEAPYSALSLTCLLLATSTHGALVALGIQPRFSIPETLIMTSVLVASIYPLVKFFQKQEDPARPVLREMLSVYTGRGDRLFLLLVLAAVTAILSRESRPVDPARIDSAFALARLALTLYGTGFFLIWTVASMLDQGVAFFDPRIENTYVARALRQQPASPPESDQDDEASPPGL